VVLLPLLRSGFILSESRMAGAFFSAQSFVLAVLRLVLALDFLLLGFVTL
jgi:hypothetical protein